MIKISFVAGKYTDLSLENLKESIVSLGFGPLLITDPPGRSYSRHTHAEVKLLVFVSGSMRVKVAGDVFECRAGDELIIPGNVEHEAVVGEEGCEFFWAEKLIEST